MHTVPKPMNTVESATTGYSPVETKALQDHGITVEFLQCTVPIVAWALRSACSDPEWGNSINSSIWFTKASTRILGRELALAAFRSNSCLIEGLTGSTLARICKPQGGQYTRNRVRWPLDFVYGHPLYLRGYPITSLVVITHWLKHFSTYSISFQGWVSVHLVQFLASDDGERTTLLRSVEKRISAGPGAVIEEGAIASVEEDEAT